MSERGILILNCSMMCQRPNIIECNSLERDVKSSFTIKRCLKRRKMSPDKVDNSVITYNFREQSLKVKIT